VLEENYQPKNPKETNHIYYMKHAEEKKQQTRKYYAEHKDRSASADPKDVQKPF